MKVETQLKRKRSENEVSKVKKTKSSDQNVIKQTPNVSKVESKQTPKVNSKSIVKETENTIALHKLNFKYFKIQGIQTMCFNKNKTVLAISRFNGEIQFWNTQSTPWCPFKV
jgi:hypothetical protein